MKKTTYVLLLALFACCNWLQAQEENDELYDFSLEELMDIQIESASKKQESWFDAPVSSYTVTRGEIQKAGVTSIPDALRLCPEVIVREQTNGVYSVYLRGFDNLAKFTNTVDQINTLTLVMVDNRPVFNYNRGGVYWESLPIDLIDIERIEIVRGPAAPLFGPNAVTGVINIITTKADKEGVSVQADVQGGSYGTLIAGASVFHKPSEKWNYGASFNTQKRDRYTSDYYEYYGDRVVQDPNDLVLYGDQAGIPLADADSKYPTPAMAMDRYGINGFINFTPNEDVDVALSFGYQDAEAQLVRLNHSATPFSFTKTKSSYFNVNASFKGISARISHNSGDTELSVGSSVVNTNYNYKISDLLFEYDILIGEKFAIRPGFNLQQSVYDDFGEGFVKGKHTLNNYAASMRLDYNPIDPLRLVGAIRADWFTHPDDTYLSYQLAGTYKFSERFLLRATASKSNNGAFIVPSFLSIDPISIPVNPFLNAELFFTPNKDLKLANINMIELGFRVKAKDNLHFDFNVYQQTLKDMSVLMVTGAELVGNIPPTPSVLSQDNQFYNLNIEAKQIGGSLAMNWVPGDKWQLKPFIAFQTTDTDGLPAALFTPQAAAVLSSINPALEPDDHIDNTSSAKHESTPEIYGGAYINYAPVEGLNINLNPYYLGSHTQYHEADLERESTVGNIDSKLIMNAKVSYTIKQKFTLYVNARNFTNASTREFYGTDETASVFLGGFNLKF